jgi:N-acetylglucosamine kinase-like BadF-type ATPase
VSDKNRIAIDIPKEAVAELEKMKKALHIRTNTELIRYSLGLMALVVKHKTEGYDILVKKGDEVAKLIMPFG